jgi:acetylornithine deacetylase
MVEAVAAVASSGMSLKRGVQIALVVGEEEYGDGVEALIEDELIEAPLTIVGEPTGLRPCTRHFGYVEYEMAGEGTRVHAALARQAANAIHATLDWVAEIFSGVHRLPFASEASISLREIRGGTGLFVVPNKCELVLDVHLPPGERVDTMDEVIETARARIAKRHARSALRSERLYWAPGYVIPEGEPGLKPLLDGFRAMEMPWDPDVFPSHSDASLLHRHGTLPVVCGPGKLEVAHTPEECVSLSETLQAARLYAALIHAACIA